MIITVTQPEIEVGVQMYLASLGVSLKDAAVSMSFTQKRVGGQGIIAEVDITPISINVSAKPTTSPLVALNLPQEFVEEAAEYAGEEVAEVAETERVTEAEKFLNQVSDNESAEQTTARSLFNR